MVRNPNAILVQLVACSNSQLHSFSQFFGFAHERTLLQFFLCGTAIKPSSSVPGLEPCAASSGTPSRALLVLNTFRPVDLLVSFQGMLRWVLPV